MKRLLRVLFLPADDGGCGYHRIRLWNDAFNRLGIADSALLDPSEDEKETKLAIDNADIIVSRLNTLPYIKLIKSSFPNKIVVFDHDDNTLEIKYSNPSYKDFGTQDVWVKSSNIKETKYYKEAPIGVKLKMEERGEIPVWVTGITPGFNRFNNLEHHTGLIYALSACEMSTSPTPELSKLWKKYSDYVAVIPNCLDLRYYPDVEVKREREEGEIRIGWSGGSSHSHDWKTLVPSMRKIIEKYPKVKFVVSGSYFPEVFDEFEDNIEYYPWTKWEAHAYRMKLLDLDFAVIPLEEDGFNKYKSELKMMEFAALKVPMIVKDQLPYSPYIKRNETALSYKTEGEFLKCVDKMVDNRDNIRETLIKGANEWVKKERDIDKLAPDVVRLYTSLLPENIQKQIELVV